MVMRLQTMMTRRMWEEGNSHPVQHHQYEDFVISATCQLLIAAVSVLCRCHQVQRLRLKVYRKVYPVYCKAHYSFQVVDQTR